MNFIKFHPTKDITNFHNNANRYFYNHLPSTECDCYFPRIDLYENDESVFIEAEIPGVDKSDIKITLQDNILTIEGEKKKNKVSDGQTCLRSERTYGAFKRNFKLYDDINRDNVNAEYEKGILRVILSKIQPKDPEERTINVK